MPDSMPSAPRKTDFVTTTPLIPNLLTIKCKCGTKFEVSLDDVHLLETITKHPCCREDVPLAELKEAIETFSSYVEARARLLGHGWDADLVAPPWNC